jgi:hypothetical protein
MNKLLSFHALGVFLNLCFFTALARADRPYDLSHVDGIESFGGSAGAQHLLATNGFVVAVPTFEQIFQPYIESPIISSSSMESKKWNTLRARDWPSFRECF